MHYKLALSDSTLETIRAFQSTYEIDPEGIYCLLTGKRIGTSDIDELIELIESFSDDDPEGRADDLAMRLFGSMRPSMRWNKMRSESLETLRKSNPLETLSYLLNRLFSSHINRGEGFVVEHGERIKTFQHISAHFNSADEDFDSVMLMLLEIDSKQNLLHQQSPFICRKFLSECKSIATLSAWLLPFYEKIISRHEALQAEARFVQANPLAKSAYLRTFLESKPISRTASQKSAKQAERQFFSDLFDSLNGTSQSEILNEQVAKLMDKPKSAIPSVRMPMRFGVKSADT